MWQSPNQLMSYHNMLRMTAPSGYGNSQFANPHGLMSNNSPYYAQFLPEPQRTPAYLSMPPQQQQFPPGMLGGSRAPVRKRSPTFPSQYPFRLMRQKTPARHQPQVLDFNSMSPQQRARLEKLI